MKTFLSCLLFGLSFSTSAQIIYAPSTNTNSFDYPLDAIELPGEKYAFVIGAKDSVSHYCTIKGIVVITDNHGSILHQILLPNPFTIIPQNIHYTEGKLYITSMVDSFDFQPRCARVSILDTVLYLLDEKTYRIDDTSNQYIFDSYSSLYNNKIYCIVSKSRKTPSNLFYRHPQINVYDLNGNKILQSELDTTFFPNIAGNWDYNICTFDFNIDTESGKFYFSVIAQSQDSIGNGGPGGGNFILEMDTTLSLSDWIKIGCLDQACDTSIKSGQLKIEAFADGKVIVSGVQSWFDITNIEKNGISRFDFPGVAPSNDLPPTSNTVIQDSIIGNTTLKDLGRNSISIRNNKVFTLGHNYCNPAFIIFPSNNMLIIAASDTNTNLQWVKYVGNDANYFPDNILATSDGGCIILSHRFDSNNPAAQFDHYIFKLDGNGNFLSVTELNTGSKKMVAVYPNPATDVLHFRFTDYGKYEIRIHDMNGRKLLATSCFGSEANVNIEILSPGIYNYRIIDNSGKTYSGIWLKK